MYDELAGALKSLDPAEASYASQFVDLLLAEGHLPGAQGEAQ